MNWRKLARWFLYPHPAVSGTLLPLALIMMLCSAGSLGSEHPLTITSYALSFYGLVLVCLRIPDMLRAVQRFRQENRYYLRYRSDVQLRINLSLYGACGFNGVYAVFQLCLGLWHHSAWFYAMAGYYLLLALMRLTLVRHTRSHTPGEDTALEWRKYRFCGMLLMVMNLALTIFTLYFVYRIRTFLHHEITTIAMAAYTFAALTLAIVNAVRYKRYGSPAYSAAKAISLASALVSLLTLENAMFTAFGQENSELFRQIMLGATGMAVILGVQGIALYMIINACRKLRSYKT
ncbi:MAG: hypothetical protein IJZ74_06300 [Clostridia bacterium]|nr:hypothetical protein [Clostridia bacterium]